MGPLSGLRVVELAGIGPVPFCSMVLGDLGADVLRVDRPVDAHAEVNPGHRYDVIRRSSRSCIVDLKAPAGRDLVLDLASRSDVFLEGYRPGVAERLGLGPEECTRRNKRLVYGRMTGWGQDGPLAPAAGHDINYIAISGVLDSIGREGGPPVPPLNLVGDFGGGGLLLAFGVLAAVYERSHSGQGQVVDAAVSDGAALLMAATYGARAAGRWNEGRGRNLADSGAPFYDVYETEDGKWMAVGAIEQRFFDRLVSVLGIQGGPSRDRENWAWWRSALEAKFKTGSQSDWIREFDGQDACVSPVLGLDSAPSHPHNVARQTFLHVGGVEQPAAAPRFSRTVPGDPSPPPVPGSASVEALADWGLDPARVRELLDGGVVSDKR